MNREDDDDDTPQLSAQTLAALQDFYNEQTLENETTDDNTMPSEDWQLSQFWYDEHTAEVLAKEAIAESGPNGSIACISCPTLYKKINELLPESSKAVILEYDQRFSIFKDDFIYYDYNKPLELPKEFSKAFDVVVADPPFLANECLTKTAVTVRYMAKNKIILCTGAVMEEMAGKLLGLTVCSFKPKHTRNLANEFRCYINYDSKLLQGTS